MEVLPAGWLQTLGFCSVPFPRPNPRFNSRIRSRVAELASQPWTPNEKKVTILSPVCVSVTGDAFFPSKSLFLEIRT
ncbi:hypothetical protein COLO4_03940 [Corchorus olitorius]|uniref:Uncharacterized protein n=1 Tax=Corchorus olitorius TaxID=93759 RepID=A0A1R3KW33_9ROSI|nr:hypothetical protein COLO4_03940 [Corchorus olitorius]